MNQKEVWKPADIPDLKGRVIIITGGNSGLGLEAAKALSAKGAHIILACRDQRKGEAAKAMVLSQCPDAGLEVMNLDLMDLKSVYNFSMAFLKNFRRLDILLNNAGIMMVPYRLTKDGFESQLGTNHLGHFALTGLLIDLIVQTPYSRVVNVSSKAHMLGTIDFENLMFSASKGYTPMKAYARSKLANLLFTYELQRRFVAAGSNSIAVAAHPGVSSTNLARHIDTKWFIQLARPVLERIIQPPVMGALPEIRAAADPGVQGGEYYGPARFGEMSGYPVLVKSSRASYNRADALRLWQISEKVTSFHFKLKYDDFLPPGN